MEDHPATERVKWPLWVRIVKMIVLLSMWLAFTIQLCISKEEPHASIDSFDMSKLKTLNVLLGALVLVLMYVFIVFELTHRTLAAILASSLSIAVLSVVDERPNMVKIMSFVDVDTLLLLFSMMILVAILVPSGIFDYSALLAYKITHGRAWPLINFLSLFTLLMAMVLDNVTTVILVTPVIIRICELSNMKPIPVLMIIIFASNLGGIMTPIGDPPNIIIMGNQYFQANGLTFLNFTTHVLVSGTVCCIAGFLLIRYGLFRKENDIKYSLDDVEILQHQIQVFKKAESHITEAYSKDEEQLNDIIQAKLATLQKSLTKRSTSSTDAFHLTLQELESRFVIRDKPLLIKGLVCLGLALFMFIMHSVEVVHLSYAWTALSGMLLYIIVAEKDDDFEHYLHQVEFATLLFFACLFILMECISSLGLIPFIGNQMEIALMHLSPDARLPVAIVLIMWLGGVLAAFVDNIPVAAMMIKILESVHTNKELDLPLLPLIFTLVLSVGLGSNGTQIAASTNIVASGLAEQHGYKISFMTFFRAGFPLMIVTLCVGTIVDIMLYVVIKWR